MLYTCSVQDLPQYRHATCWLVCHYAGRVPRTAYDEWVPDLAPSRGLHHRWAHNWRPLRDPALWWVRHYLPAWSAEKTLDPAYAAAIDRAAALSRHSNLALACWCLDESHCHRSLVATAVRQHPAPTLPLPDRHIVTTVAASWTATHFLATLAAVPALTSADLQGDASRTKVLRALRSLEHLGLVVRDTASSPNWSITDAGRAVWAAVLLRRRSV